MPQFCIKFGRKSIKKLITNGVLMKRLIKQFGKPQKVITDQAPSTKVAMAKVIKAFKLKPDCHCTSKYLNNLIEQDHRHIKVRKTRYQSINTAKNTLKGIECIYA